MKYLIQLSCLWIVAIGVSAEEVERQLHTGETLKLYTLENGERWGSFFLSDQSLAEFNFDELIVLQVDSHKPVKLVQGMRSCGAPARNPQQVDYLFVEDTRDKQWSFQQTTQAEPVLKLFGWDDEKYHSVASDLRPTVIDFPVRDKWFRAQLSNASQVTLRYATSEGKQITATFDLE